MKPDKCEKLIRIVTRSYAPFLIYSAVFMALIVFLMSVIQIDSYSVYECATDESDEIVKVNREDVRLKNGTTLIFLEDEVKAFVKKNGSARYYVEVPLKSSIMQSMLAGVK